MRWGLFLGVLLVAAAAHGHDLRFAGVTVRQGDPTEVTASLPLSLFDQSGAEAVPLFDQEFRSRLRLSVDGAAWVPQTASVTIDAGAGIVRWVGQGTGSGAWTLDGSLTSDVPGMKTRFSLEGGGEALVSANAVTLGSSPARTGRVIGEYFPEGVIHILTGWDHLCFLLALLLGGASWRRWFKLISAFTLAHSLTLTLSVLGLVRLSPQWVEPLIALSIVVVAVWNLSYQDRDLGFWWALGFGLLHGFGFAGALGEVGVPADALGWALLSFNLGVEAGQLLAVAAVGALLMFAVRQKPTWNRSIVMAGSAAVALLGAAWFGTRILGGI